MAVDIKDTTAMQQPETLVQATMGVDVVRPRSGPEALGQQLREEMKQKNPREVMEMVASRGQHSLEEMTVAIDRNISVEDVTKNKGKRERAPGSLNEQRFNEAVEHARLANELLDKGYDQMENGDKRQARERVKVAMQSYWPEAATAFSGMSATDIDLMMETFLRDPAFGKAMGEHFASLQKNRVPEISTELQKKFLEAENAFKEQDGKRNVVRKELETAESIYEDFQKTTKGSEGGKLKSLGNLSDAQREVATLSSDVDHFRQEKRKVESALAQIDALEDAVKGGHTLTPEQQNLINDKARYAGELTKATSELSRLEPSLTSAHQKVEEIERLDQKKQKALEDMTRLRSEYGALTTRRNKAQKEMYLTQADLNHAQQEHAQAEQAFVQELEDLYARAAEDILNGRLEKAEDARLELVKQAGEDGFAMKLRDRWNITEKNKVKLDKDVIKSDFATLLDTGGGPKEVVVKMLMDQPQSMSEAQAKEYMALNPDKAKDMEREATLQLMSKVLQKGSGIKPNEEHLRIIQESEWGEDLIEDALRKNEAHDEVVKGLKERGLFNSGSWKEGMIKALPRAALTLLLLALTGVLGWDTLATMNVVPGIGRAVESVRE